MTLYPSDIDSDLEIPRIEDNITEIGGTAINALREATFAIEETLGVNPQGSVNDISTFLSVSHNSDGTIKPASLSSVGLVSLPILSSMFNDYTIPEVKLILDHSTASLFALATSSNVNIANLNVTIADYATRLSTHIFGVPESDGYTNRHVASHIDINDGYTTGGTSYIGIDARDIMYNNTGLYNRLGAVRSAKTVMDALIQINNDLVAHSISIDGYHTASFINVNTGAFNTIPTTVNTVQKFVDYVDDLEKNIINQHNILEHSNGIPRYANVELSDVDGYNKYYGPFTATASINSYYENLLTFAPTVGLDFAFADLNVGDIVKINYGGFLSEYGINKIEYVPTTTYKVYIDGYHLALGATSSILEKSSFDDNSFGELAVVASNHDFYQPGHSTTSIAPGGVIVVPPNCGVACGMDLDLSQLDSTHYNLYIGFYPNGNPSSVNLVYPTVPAIDVTGNLGVTPGQYTLPVIISNINKIFRSSGYNFRMAAFEYKGQLGLALTDSIDNVGFSIISGLATGSTVAAGEFINNVVDVANPLVDAFGFGSLKSNVASPKYIDDTSTSLPTKVFFGRKNKKYLINGEVIDYVAAGYYTNVDGYYSASLVSVQNLTSERIAATYRVEIDIENKKILPGSSITVLPMSYADSRYVYSDYGRFIIDSIDSTCNGYSYITTVSMPSINGDPLSSVTDPLIVGEIPVRIYFGDDSVNVPKASTASKVNYEIFVKKGGETFAHKRALLPTQSSTVVMLDTSIGVTNVETNYGWHINQVSPKLKGKTRVGSTDNKKYVRLCIGNYDAGTGLYDGYICQSTTVVGPNPPYAGAISRTRIGDTARYYDINGVDYIEVSFQQAPDGSLVFPGGVNYTYVDIEVFESLRNNENYMVLSCVEQLNVNSDSTVWNIVDLRNFGNVSEKILSTSAIKFVESGNRLIHTNGVFSGFDEASTTTSYVSLKGGSCLVNGVVVNKNDFVIYPYSIYSTDPDSVQFVICLNEFGAVELLPFSTSLSNAVYNYSGSAVGFVNFVTLPYLLRYRKDLLPLYIVNTTSSSSGYVIDSVEDIRAFISNNELKESLVLYNDSESFGSFSNWSAISSFAYYCGAVNSTIKVKGDTVIDSVVDFKGAPVSIIGEKGNTVTVTSSVGIKLYSNMSVEGLNFVRKMTGGPGSSSGIYVSEDRGELLLSFSSTNSVPVRYENVTVKNCTFSTYSASYRFALSPHIGFRNVGDAGYLSNIDVKNNRFLEEDWQCCIAFVNELGESITSAPTSDGTILTSVCVENNIGNINSYILLSSDNNVVGSRGLCPYNLNVKNNNIDYIFYNLSKYRDLDSNNITNLPLLSSGFIVEGNSFTAMANRGLNNVATDLGDLYVVSPKTTVINNRFGYAYLQSNRDSSYNYESIIVSNNIMTSALGLVWLGSGVYIAGSCATLNSSDTVAVVSNNIMKKGNGSGYNYGIYSNGISCDIVNNTLDSCFANITNYCIRVNVSTLSKYNICGNIISRKDSTVSAYVGIIGSNVYSAVVSNNIFDSEYIDAGNTISNVINITSLGNVSYKLKLDNNKNQRFNVDLFPSVTNDAYKFGGARFAAWNKNCFITTATAPNWESYNTLGSALDLTYLYDDGSSYYIAPLIINVPYVDGAKINAIYFKVSLNNTINDNCDIYPHVETLDFNTTGSSWLFDPTVLKYTFSNLSSSGLSIRNAAGYDSVKIDMSSISTSSFSKVSSANALRSTSTPAWNSYSYPILVVFYKDYGKTLSAQLKRTNSAVFDFITIKEIYAEMVW